MSCVKPFVPSGLPSDNRYLVVDGVIALGSSTDIRLSRTRNLSDTASSAPERNARILIESESGEIIGVSESNTAGTYSTLTNISDPATRYRVRIITDNGREYLSDFVEAKQTPAIDSLEWEQDGDIFIYLNTKDAGNKTRYYRWDFTETAEYHTPYSSNLDYKNGEVIFLPQEEQRHICFNTYPSANILLGSTASLSEDVIERSLITIVPNDNSKISERYSILVKQYALTAEAYQYWLILRQNSQQTGGLFDPQPSQLTGNIHCLNDPDEPVIGFISACSISEKRLFILYSQLKDKKPNSNSVLCREILVSLDSASYYLNDGTKLPAYFRSSATVAVAPKVCVDCRLSGGVTARPSFW